MKNLVAIITVIVVFAAIGYAFSTIPTVSDIIEDAEWSETVTVRSGETLWSIARRLNKNGKYDTRLIVNAIEEVNDTDPIIRPGQELIIPAE